MIEKLIKRIALQLDKGKIPYMIIGGQAVLLYGTPRLTRDIDITLGIDTDKFLLVERLSRRLNLKPLMPNPENFARETKVFPVEGKRLKIRVDFIFSFTEYEKQAMQRAKKVLIDGYAVKFASREDLIIHKMLAARAVDEEDMRGLLIKHKNRVNLKYIKKWLLEFDRISELKGISGRFNKLLKSLSA
jgi:predicted nucleotidyltransferase